MDDVGFSFFRAKNEKTDKSNQVKSKSKSESKTASKKQTESSAGDNVGFSFFPVKEASVESKDVKQEEQFVVVRGPRQRKVKSSSQVDQKVHNFEQVAQATKTPHNLNDLQKPAVSLHYQKNTVEETTAVRKIVKNLEETNTKTEKSPSPKPKVVKQEVATKLVTQQQIGGVEKVLQEKVNKIKHEQSVAEKKKAEKPPSEIVKIKLEELTASIAKIDDLLSKSQHSFEKAQKSYTENVIKEVSDSFRFLDTDTEAGKQQETSDLFNRNLDNLESSTEEQLEKSRSGVQATKFTDLLIQNNGVQNTVELVDTADKTEEENVINFSTNSEESDRVIGILETDTIIKSLDILATEENKELEESHQELSKYNPDSNATESEEPKLVNGKLQSNIKVEEVSNEYQDILEPSVESPILTQLLPSNEETEEELRDVIKDIDEISESIDTVTIGNLLGTFRSSESTETVSNENLQLVEEAISEIKDLAQNDLSASTVEVVETPAEVSKTFPKKMDFKTQIRVLTLNDNEHQESTLYRIEKGYALHFRLGPSLLGRKVLLFTTYPPNNEAFKRDHYYQLGWKQDEGCTNADDTALYTEIIAEVSGSFHYYFTYANA